MTVVASAYVNYRSPGTLVLGSAGAIAVALTTSPVDVGVSWGADDADASRKLLALILFNQGVGTADPTAVSIGGLSMTKIVGGFAVAGSMSAWIVNAPGAVNSGQLSVASDANGQFGYDWGVWACYHLQSNVAQASSGVHGPGNPDTRTVAVLKFGIAASIADNASSIGGDFTGTTYGGSRTGSVGTLNKQQNAGTRAANYNSIATGALNSHLAVALL